MDELTSMPDLLAKLGWESRQVLAYWLDRTDIPTVKHGRDRFVRTADLESVLDQLRAARLNRANSGGGRYKKGVG